ncbi:MAG: hypothetical protein Q7N50_11545 [Armatimonadota bacterium]|nr:hypothetical protein [Armatimonadota bacterium]
MEIPKQTAYAGSGTVPAGFEWFTLRIHPPDSLAKSIDGYTLPGNQLDIRDGPDEQSHHYI